MSTTVKPCGCSRFSEEELTELVKGIDPDTAEVHWSYTQALDPYGINPGLPEECECVGRDLFVRSLPKGIWVWVGDLPSELRDALMGEARPLAVAVVLSDDIPY